MEGHSSDLPVLDAVVARLSRISTHSSITTWQIVVACLGLWVLWATTGAMYAWLRTDLCLRRSGIPKGPGFMHLLAIAGSTKIHRAIVDWTREFGEIFWFRMGPIHVRAPIRNASHPTRLDQKGATCLVKTCARLMRPCAALRTNAASSNAFVHWKVRRW